MIVATKGVMEVTTNEGKKKVHDIYNTPNMKHNLLSLGKIMVRNYKLVFDNVKCVIYDKNNENRLVTTITMIKNRLFPLNFGGEGGHLQIWFHISLMNGENLQIIKCL